MYTLDLKRFGADCWSIGALLQVRFWQVTMKEKSQMCSICADLLERLQQVPDVF